MNPSPGIARAKDSRLFHRSLFSIAVGERLDKVLHPRLAYSAKQIHTCDYRRIYLAEYDIYKLWGEGGVSVSWSSTTTSNEPVSTVASNSSLSSDIEAGITLEAPENHSMGW